MVSFISKFLFTATVTAPTFLSLGLIGVIKDSTNYFQLWDDMLEKIRYFLLVLNGGASILVSDLC